MTFLFAGFAAFAGLAALAAFAARAGLPRFVFISSLAAERGESRVRSRGSLIDEPVLGPDFFMEGLFYGGGIELHTTVFPFILRGVKFEFDSAILTPAARA